MNHIITSVMMFAEISTSKLRNLKRASRSHDKSELIRPYWRFFPNIWTVFTVKKILSNVFLFVHDCDGHYRCADDAGHQVGRPNLPCVKVACGGKKRMIYLPPQIEHYLTEDEHVIPSLLELALRKVHRSPSGMYFFNN